MWVTLEETGNKCGSSAARNNDYIAAMTLSRDPWVSIAKTDNHRQIEVQLEAAAVEFSYSCHDLESA